jgi:hypothetical protein
MIRKNTLTWHGRLDDMIDAINSDYNKVLRGTPAQVMFQYFADSPEIASIAARKRAIQEAKFKEHSHQQFHVRDRVRVRMDALFSSLRKRVKEGDAKKTVVRWSPDLYIVVKVLPVPRGRVGYETYFIASPDRKIVKTQQGKPRPFNAGELLSVAKGTVSHISNQDAAKLNKVKYRLAHAPEEEEEEEESSSDEEEAPIVDPLTKEPDVLKWGVGLWREALVDKEFPDEDGVASVVLQVERKGGTKEKPNFLVTYRHRTYTGGPKKYVQTLPDALTDMRNEQWFRAEFLQAMQAYA